MAIARRPLNSYKASMDDILNFRIPITTEWALFVPTITGYSTTSNIVFYWKRVGDTIFIRGTFTAGTASAVLVSFTLPNSLNVSSAKIPISNTTAAAGPTVGLWSVNTANPQRTNAVTATGTNANLIYGGGPQTTTPLVPATGTAAFAAGVTAVEAQVPIDGWAETQSIKEYLGL